MKSVRNNQSRISRPLCLKHLNLRCLGSADEISCYFCARRNGTDQESEQEQSQTTKDFEHFEHYAIPELRELLSKKGQKILPKSIRGLLGKKPRIYHLLDAFKNIGIFSVRETHFSTNDEAQAQIDGFTFFGKSRASGQGGGVGAYISSSVPFYRRRILSKKTLSVYGLRFYSPKAKAFLLELSIALQNRKNISSRILIANLNQCYHLCLWRTKNAY